MSRFLKTEKPRQAAFKLTSPYFSGAARAAGIYKGHPYTFCLPVAHAEENLLPEIRTTAPAFFDKHSIKWHDGHNGLPSNHMCDSQVCGVNFLFPFAHRPDELAIVLRPFFPDLRQMLPIEDGQYVTFEWIGAENYLREKIYRNGKRTRGANFTSADAAVMFERTDGGHQIVLIEWKYTESYSPTPLRWAKSGTDRMAIYQHLYDRADGPLANDRLPSFEALFFEPFYQLARQQYLAFEMEKAQELGAQAVSVLHIAPSQNTDFQRVTSPLLEPLGNTATGIWAGLVQPGGKFISLSTERLFGRLSAEQLPAMRDWLDYVGTRYAWIHDH